MKNSCQNPPSAKTWMLPPAPNTVPNWDTDTTTWYLPLYGLTATILNTNPNIITDTTFNTPSDKYCMTTAVDGKCTGDTCNPWTNTCGTCSTDDIMTSLTYTSSLNDQCTISGTGCDGAAGCLCFNVACSSICSKADPNMTCPSGTMVSFLPSDKQIYDNAVTSGTPLNSPPRVTCSYVPYSIGDPSGTGLNIQTLAKYNFPNGWAGGVVARYALYKFFLTYNSDVYGDYKSSFHQIYDIQYPEASHSLLISQYISNANIVPILMCSPLSVQQNYLTNFQNMLRILAQLHNFTVNNGVFSLQYYSYGVSNKSTDSLVLGMTSQPTAADMTNAIRAFTTETVSNTNNNAKMMPISTAPNNDIPFVYPPTNQDLLNNPYYIFVDLNSLKVYNIGVDTPNLISISQAIKSNPQGDFFVVGRIFEVTITKLSPVVAYWYGTLYPGILEEVSVAKRIINDVDVYPEQYYNAKCMSGSFDDDCKNIMITGCNQTSQLPYTIFPKLSIGINQFFLSNNSPDCQCYNTKLRPDINSDAQRIPGMCFTGACTANPALMKAFGLSNEVCAQYCPQIYDWLSSGQVMFEEYLDPVRYKQLCGVNYVPSPARTLNYTILLIWSGVSILLTAAVWWVYRLSVPKTVIIGILMMITVFIFSIILNGRPICNPNPLIKEQICLTGLKEITDKLRNWSSNTTFNSILNTLENIRIPQLFCSYGVACQCLVDGGCPYPDQQQCISGMCIYK